MVTAKLGMNNNRYYKVGYFFFKVAENTLERDFKNLTNRQDFLDTDS